MEIQFCGIRSLMSKSVFVFFIVAFLLKGIFSILHQVNKKMSECQRCKFRMQLLRLQFLIYTVTVQSVWPIIQHFLRCLRITWITSVGLFPFFIHSINVNLVWVLKSWLLWANCQEAAITLGPDTSDWWLFKCMLNRVSAGLILDT